MNQADVITEGRRRLRLSAPWLTDEQFAAWLAAARSRGAEFALTPEGIAAHHPRTPLTAGPVAASIEVNEQATAPSRVDRARAKTPRALESRLPGRVDPEVIPGSESAPACRVGGAR